MISKGDIVEATSRIVRFDSKCALEIGDKATVIDIYQSDSKSPQIVDVAIKNGMRISNIICKDGVPLSPVYG